MGANNAKDLQTSQSEHHNASSSSSNNNGKIIYNDILYVLFDFKASFENQVSLNKGEYVKLLKYNPDKNWCEVMKLDSSQSVGWVPSNYLTTIQTLNATNSSSLYQAQAELINCPWYHGKITRQDGENLLRSGINGSFLIRQSESQPGQLSVTLRYEGRVYHYRITYNGVAKKFFITESNQFNKISELVDYHSKYPEGLISPLLYPVMIKSVTSSIPTSFHNSINSQQMFMLNPHSSTKSSSQLSSNNSSSNTNPDNWEIDRSEILMHQKLGGGQYGDVYEAVWKRYNVIVAVKTLKDDFHLKLDDFLKEAVIMKRLKHKNLVQLYGVCSNEPPYYLVTEFISKGSLLEFLKSCNRLEVTPYVLIYMAIQIASGMAFLEANNFIHRDLAARNCLVGEYYTVKIGDFGLARYMTNNSESYTAKLGAKFPIKWTAPESLAYNRFSSKSDIWSFGVVLWELATYGSMPPYPGVELQDVYHLIEKGYRLDKPEGCPQIVYALMLKCWEWDPVLRPNFSQLLSCLELLYFGNRDNSELYTSNVFGGMTSPPTLLSKSKPNSNSEPYLAKSSFSLDHNQKFNNNSNSNNNSSSNIRWPNGYLSSSSSSQHGAAKSTSTVGKTSTTHQEQFHRPHTDLNHDESDIPDESGVGESIMSTETASLGGSLTARPLITYQTSSHTSSLDSTTRMNLMRTTATAATGGIGVNSDKKIQFRDECGVATKKTEVVKPLSIKNANYEQFSTIPAKDRIDNYFKSLRKIDEGEIIHQHERSKSNSYNPSNNKQRTDYHGNILEEDDITSLESNTESPQQQLHNYHGNQTISSLESEDDISNQNNNHNNAIKKLNLLSKDLLHILSNNPAKMNNNDDSNKPYFIGNSLKILIGKLVKYRNCLNVYLVNKCSDESYEQPPQELLNYFNIIFTNITTNYNEGKLINSKCFADLKETIANINNYIK